MIFVQSSDLRAVDHNWWNNTLTIVFHSGGVYEFYEVPRSEFDGLLNASSHGKYFHAHIKNHYDYRRIG